MKTIETQAKTIDAAIEEALEKLGLGYDEVEVEILSNGGMFKKAKVKVTQKATSIEQPTLTTKNDREASVTTKYNKEEPATRKTNDTPDISELKTDNTQKEKPQTKENKESETKKETREPIKETTGDTGLKLQKCVDFISKLFVLLDNDSVITTETTDNAFNINVTGDNVGILIGKEGKVLDALQTLISSIAIANANGEGKRVYINVEDYKERRKETLIALAKKKADIAKETGRYIKLEPMNSKDRAIIHSALQGLEGIRTYSTGKDPYRYLCIAPADKK